MNTKPAPALSASSQIALRASLSVLTGGRFTVTMDECLTHVRARYPIMGRVVERRDIAQQLRRLGFLRDHAMGGTGYRHKDWAIRHPNYVGEA